MVQEIPLAVILSWPSPNTVNPETRGPANLIVNVVLLSIAITVVAIRFYTRYTRKLGWDDIWCFVALIFNIAFGVCSIIASSKYHIDRHLWDIQLSNLTAILKLAATCKFLFTIAGTCIRQSLLCFYNRLLGEAGITWFRWVLRIATVLNLVIGLFIGVTSIIICSPVSAFWKYPSIAYGKCLNEGALGMASGAILAVVDFATVLLPVPLIWRLTLSKSAKIGVICLLTTGSLASVAAIVRTYFIWKALYDTYDISWWAYPLFLVASVEINLAIICCCGPALRQFGRNLRTKASATSYHSGQGQPSLHWPSRTPRGNNSSNFSATHPQQKDTLFSTSSSAAYIELKDTKGLGSTQPEARDDVREDGEVAVDDLNDMEESLVTTQRTIYSKTTRGGIAHDDEDTTTRPATFQIASADEAESAPYSQRSHAVDGAEIGFWQRKRAGG